MSRTSSLGQFTLLPVLADAADITAVGTTMADRIEKYVNMRFATGAARDAVITVPEAGMQVFLTTPNVMTFYDGTAWRGEWVTTFSPQIDQGATTNIAKTVTVCEYRYDGPMIDVEFMLAVTGAGTAASAVTMTLPVAAASGTAGRTVGCGVLIDSSTGLRYVCGMEQQSTTQVNFGTDQQAGGSPWGISPNLALANGDALRGSMRYRWV